MRLPDGGATVQNQGGCRQLPPGDLQALKMQVVQESARDLRNSVASAPAATGLLT